MHANVVKRVRIGASHLFVVIAALVLSLASTHASIAATLSSPPQISTTQFVFSQDGDTFAAVGNNGRIRVFDLASGLERATAGSETDGVVTGLALSPDGKTLARVAGGIVTVWDVVSGRQHAILSGAPQGVITDLSFSPDGKRLAGVAGHANIVVWDVQSGSRKWSFSAGDSAVSTIAFSADGSLLASSGSGPRIQLWDMVKGRERSTLSNRSAAPITNLVFSPMGMTLAAVDANADITLWDPVHGKIKQELQDKRQLITTLSFSPNGALLATGGTDPQISMWNVKTGDKLRSLPGYFDYIATGLAFSPDGKTLASVGNDNLVMLWDVTTGSLRQTLVGHGTHVAGIAYSTDHNTLASVGVDGQLIVWDLATGNARFVSQIAALSSDNQGAASTSINSVDNAAGNTTPSPSGFTTQSLLTDILSTGIADGSLQVANNLVQNAEIRRKDTRPKKHDWQGVTALTVSPDGKFIGSAYSDSTLRLWGEAGDERAVFSGHHGTAATSIVFSADGKKLISSGRDTEVHVWNLATDKLSQTLTGLEHPVRTIAASSDGKFIAGAGEETRIMLWDAKTGRLSKILNGHTGFVNALAFSPDGQLLASAGADARIIIWDPATGKELRSLYGHTGEVNALAFDPTGKTLVSGGEDKLVKVWDVATGQQLLSLSGHQAPVRAVAVSPNGKTLVSTGEDSRILIWDSATGQLRKVLPGSNRFINSLIFEQNGQLLTGDEAGDITNWDVKNVKKLKTLKPIGRPSNSSSAAGSTGLPVNVEVSSASGRNNRATATSESTVTAINLIGRFLDWVIPPAEAALPDPNQGPGGPILVITSASSTFGHYYAEILRNEGFNDFSVVDIGSVTPAMLAGYDVAILAGMPLTSTQATTLSNWVTSGGNLIAMRPSSQLASLLGLTTTGTTLSEGYLLVDGSQPSGNGIVQQTIQFHGTADRYTLNGATQVAALYTDATTPASNPAVTLRSVGVSGGHAAAFTYDLATSIVYTRQGNPAWATQERDGLPPIRSDDKFYGAASADPQPDWVNLDKVAIPQADEQQRLLANLIIRMDLDRKPLPRFWYFPRGDKAVVIMTGDDHANGGTSGRFDKFIADSPPGCSVDNWECVRGTSYIYPNPLLTDAQAAYYTSLGFEVSVHINTNCTDYTPAELENFYVQQIGLFASTYPSVPLPATERHHCIVWSDWATGAKVQLNHNIRLDTSFYFWPPGWVDNVPGLFTGSAMPMRFADLDGTLIDDYQAASQMTDESGQQYPYTIDTLLDRALGSEGYYGAYTINAHTDLPDIPEADAVVSSAQSRGVPIVSSKQMLTWLDGRNSSSFSAISWSANTLNFTVTPGVGANGLQAMLPIYSATGLLSSINGPGGAVTYTVKTIKGIDYAFFTVAAGAYTASYTVNSTAPAVNSTVPASAATGVAQGATVNATFNKAMDPSTLNSSTVILRDSANAVVPATVSYAAATQTVTLTPSSNLSSSATYTATVKGGLVKDELGNALASDYVWSFTTIAAPSCPCGAWSDATTPPTPAGTDPAAVELGVKFKVDISGFITGIRFYKGTGNTGTHVGNLWTTTGNCWRQPILPTRPARVGNR